MRFSGSYMLKDAVSTSNPTAGLKGLMHQKLSSHVPIFLIFYLNCCILHLDHNGNGKLWISTTKSFWARHTSTGTTATATLSIC